MYMHNASMTYMYAVPVPMQLYNIAYTRKYAQTSHGIDPEGRNSTPLQLCTCIIQYIHLKYTFVCPEVPVPVAPTLNKL